MTLDQLFTARKLHEVYFTELGFARVVHLFFASHDDAAAWQASNPKIDSTYIYRAWSDSFLHDLRMVEVEGPPRHVRGVSRQYDQKRSAW